MLQVLVPVLQLHRLPKTPCHLEITDKRTRLCLSLSLVRYVVVENAASAVTFTQNLSTSAFYVVATDARHNQ